MRILADIRGSLEPTRPRVARNLGPGAGRLQLACPYATILACFVMPAAFASDVGSLSESQQKFLNELAAKSRSAQSENAAVIAGVDGWFLSSDIRFLSVGQFWGADAAKVSRAHKPESADPIPAIVDFHDQLKKRGIDLLLMPVPPKAAIYPEKILPDVDLHGETAAPYPTRFYDQPRRARAYVVDLASRLIL